MATFIVGAILVLVVCFDIIYIYRQKKKGRNIGCSCGGDCSHCNGCPKKM